MPTESQALEEAKRLLREMVREGEHCQECNVIGQFSDRIAAIIGPDDPL
jgi:hypothetical protein